MELPRQTAFTADEFLAWAMEQPSGRFELDNGRVVAMAPERLNHAIAKRNLAIALHEAIKARDLPCQMLLDGMAVRISDDTVYEPDALVRCGPQPSGDVVEISDPVILVEVVSPSSRGKDGGAKLAGYFALPTVRHYLIVDTDQRVVLHHRRDDDGRIEVRILRDGTLILDPPGLEIGIRAVFVGL